MEWTIIQRWTSALELCHLEAWRNRRQFHANSATLHLCKSWRNELRFSLSRILNNETSLKAQSGRRDYRQTPSRDALETINNKVIKEEQLKGEPFTFLEHTCAVLWAWSFRELKSTGSQHYTMQAWCWRPLGRCFKDFFICNYDSADCFINKDEASACFSFFRSFESVVIKYWHHPLPMHFSSWNIFWGIRFLCNSNTKKY